MNTFIAVFVLINGETFMHVFENTDKDIDTIVNMLKADGFLIIKEGNKRCIVNMDQVAYVNVVDKETYDEINRRELIKRRRLK